MLQSYTYGTTRKRFLKHSGCRAGHATLKNKKKQTRNVAHAQTQTVMEVHETGSVFSKKLTHLTVKNLDLRRKIGSSFTYVDCPPPQAVCSFYCLGAVDTTSKIFQVSSITKLTA